ncbi:RDD family protein [Wenyingzhuangia sp. 2_MG-2023]|uniref:RDD family protein n=1 Tax=Wenyingzhuangia sp. 2_MG-2023 TaxID=3062639 RepID=UPI0026E389EE|nr:RDD family protein [Wenyingzhuangia sp. 2_MG-2023]MDO6736862.1 RDD family protein [Wenyingzhuangia sp. 2_MG-2023]MDO6800852.1 RDD family protein [Wenyingzhuangia sp. 1_MG-2023]
MAEIQITTTQNVNLDFKSAELNHRIFAWFIDSMIKSAYIGILMYLLLGILNLGKYFESLDTWSIMAVVIVLGIPVIFYTLTLETLLGGQTVGKKLMKLKVLKIDGYQTSFIDFFIRWVMRIVDVNMFSGFVALISIGSSSKGQRLGGLASGTAVVSLRNKVDISHTILEENLENNYQPTYTSVVKLSDNDVRIIKENYLKAKRKNDEELLLKLKNKVVVVIGQEPVEEHSMVQFLDVIIKDYNHYTQNM